MSPIDPSFNAQFWIAAGVFVLAYALIVSEKLHKTTVAILGAAVLLVLRVLGQHEAFKHPRNSAWTGTSYSC